MKFEDYFSFEAILGDLVKWRLAGKDVSGTLPPRAEWKRGDFRERKGRSAEAIRRAAILRTVRRVKESLSDYRWGVALTGLCDEVRETIFSGDVELDEPRMIRVPKGYKDGHPQMSNVAIGAAKYYIILASKGENRWVPTREKLTGEPTISLKLLKR